MQTQAVDFGFEPTYRLQKLEVYNWGGFSGPQAVEIDPHGTAIVGPTGSGKTTLVDALMTLLTANPKYNLASTGGHESDRDLASYVRGVSGAGNGTAGQAHVSRLGKTVTGVCATFANDHGIARLGAILWFDDSSFAASDLKKLWLFTTNPEQTLQHWLEVHHENGNRGLRQIEKNTTGIWTYPSKKRFLARTRDFFEVRENAFNLLNRAAGLKQLNSIDEIFRELVLDDASQFDRALEVANSFDDLTAIYEELEVARRQLKSLEPVKLHWQKYQTLDAQVQEQSLLIDILPIWFGEHTHKRWKTECQRLAVATQQAHSELADTEEKYQTQCTARDTLYTQYLQLGGDDIHGLETHIRDCQQLLTERERNAREYQMQVRALGLDETLSRPVLDTNQQIIREKQQQLELSYDAAREESFAAGVATKGVRDTLQVLRAEYAEVDRTPGSNIPPRFLQFRGLLAENLDVSAEEIPFVAELVQVKNEENAWRGAIERAIGSQRLRIMVPANKMKAALSWINQRNNQLHVRLYDVKEDLTKEVLQPKFMDDGFTRKLDYKQHPYREAVKYLLAGMDLHCVDSIDELHRTEHAITREGMLSGKKRFYEKQDQKRIEDDWQTGFDNKDRLKQLSQQIVSLETAAQERSADEEKSRAVVTGIERQLQFAKQLLAVEFERINIPQAEKKLAELHQKLQRLTAPNSDLNAAKERYEETKQACLATESIKQNISNELARLDERRNSAEKQKSRAWQKAEPGMTNAQRDIANHHLATFAVNIETIELLHIDDLESNTESDLRKHLEKIRKQKESLHTDLIRSMERAQKEDRGALSEVGTDLEDVPEYLKRLDVLIEEALPEKQKRFKDYLNRSSDDGVTTLLTTITEEVTRIRYRLEDVNDTLRKVDFQPGRYLQLIANDVVHESLRTFNRDVAALRSAQLAGDDGDSHYRALRSVIESLRAFYEKRTTAPAKALLDPRFRLEFKVTVIDRSNGEVLETRSGSQGGSGGEKEIIASYVLTASLSYALCPDGSSRPLFGTIVLDEAFSRSSQAVAGRIIEALSEFGLHPLFITPNKEMRLLRTYTRSAIVVHRRGTESTLTVLTWQELEQVARDRQQKASLLAESASHEIAD